MLAVQIIEPGGDVAGHFQMLGLISADRHLAGLEHQNIRRHQHRVAEQPQGHALVGILVGIGQILGDRRLVGVRAVHQPFGGDAGQHPGQFQNLRDVGLGVENDVLDLQAQRQPGRGDFQPRAMHQRGVLALDQRVVIGQEVERLHVLTAAGLNGRQDRADVVAQMRGAGGGDAGEGDFHDGGSAS
jgi:hypothetical protein